VAHPKLAVARSGYGGRGYWIPGRYKDQVDKKGEVKKVKHVYPSVTTVLKRVAKPALMQWVADQTAAFAIKNIDYLQRNEDELNWRFLRFYWSREPDLVGTAIRLYHEGVRDDSAEIGTNIHEFAEAEIGDAVYPTIDSQETEEMVAALDEWLSQHEITSHHSEFTMVNDSKQYAGTGDADWTITCLHDDPCFGEEGAFRTLVDLKSARHTWPEHGYQLAALANGEVLMREVEQGAEDSLYASKTEGGKKVESWWVEEERPPWEKYALLHIRPNDLDKDGEVIPAFCKLIDMTEDIDLDWVGFNGAAMLTAVEYERGQRYKTRKVRAITAGTES
jgi:hypothetical protein